ncbi:hypothetical protein [Spartinivicinus ruber]|uniref:hypothetical protein n=1 Tax=Spartinivicinus ruber TaxID=2683272 RepID=UPI0013D22088|nr:hypothetical protein [Spartinivicinus ruber]
MSTILLAACTTSYQPTFNGPTATLKTFYQGVIFTNQDNCSNGEYFNYAGSIFHPQVIKIPATKVNTLLFVGTPPYGNNICQMIIEFYAEKDEQYTPLFQLPTDTTTSSTNDCSMTILDKQNQPIEYRTRQLKAFRLSKYSPHCYSATQTDQAEV